MIVRPPFRDALCGVLALLLGTTVGFAQTSVEVPAEPFYGTTQLDTADLAIPSAQEVIIDVPSAFYAARHQRGEINGLRYILFPDGTGKIMQANGLRSVLFRLTCTKGVSCTIVDQDGAVEVIAAVGGPKPVFPQEAQGRALARFLAEWILAGTGEKPNEQVAQAVEEDSNPQDSAPENEALPAPTIPAANVVQSEPAQPTDIAPAQPPMPAKENAIPSCAGQDDCEEQRLTPVKTSPLRAAQRNLPRSTRPLTFGPDGRAVPINVGDEAQIDEKPEENETFFERINLACSVTGSVTLRYKNHSSGSKRFGKPRTSFGCGARFTEKLSLRVSAIGYLDKNEKSPSDADFTYALTYRATDKVTLSYSNYSARFDSASSLVDSLTSGALRASYRLPKLRLPNDKTIGCSASLGLIKIKESTVNLSCSYAVTDRFVVSGTAYGYFSGQQESWDPDFAYTASYRFNDDWSVTYSNYANNRFFWNKSSNPGEGILGGTVSLTYRFKF